NGEVYNFLALRPPLEREGHKFRTHGDTEVIVHHFEQHGVPGISALDGMFAFAIWDAPRRRLTLARDRTGIKPLYYAELADGRVVKNQLVSDVPVGIFLSGGIDSSCIASLAAAAGGRMKAFSIGFENATFDESAYAKMMAERLDVELVSETLHERNLLDVLDV